MSRPVVGVCVCARVRERERERERDKLYILFKMPLGIYMYVPHKQKGMDTPYLAVCNNKKVGKCFVCDSMCTHCEWIV